MKQLEDRIKNDTFPRLKSEGERRIAATLNAYGIPFLYEQPLHLEHLGRTNTLYPDFYLPNQELFIEYYGRTTNPDYDNRTRQKQAAYASHHIPVISLYPWDLCQDWPEKLFQEIHQYTQQNRTYSGLGPKRSRNNIYRGHSQYGNSKSGRYHR